MSMQQWWDSAFVRVKNFGKGQSRNAMPARAFSGTRAIRKLFAEQLEDRRVLTGLPPTISLPGGGGTGWSLDSTFGGDGRVTSTVAADTINSINAIAVQDDGKLVAVGSTNSGAFDFVVARFLADGSPDPTFGMAGIVTVDLGSDDVATSVAIDSQGRIVVGGRSNFDELAIVWIDPADGSIDQTFVNALPGQLGGAQLEGLAIDGSDNAVVVGMANFQEWFVARITPSGEFDDTFAGVGAREILIGNMFQSATDVLIQPDGQIVVGGWTTAEDELTLVNSYAAARLDPNGVLDVLGFGTNGIALAAINGDAQGIGLLQDGSIVLGGSALSEDLDSDIGIAKFSASGMLDFALTTDLAGGDDFGYDLAVQNDKLVVVGSTIEVNSSDPDFVLVRYNSDGTLDESLAEGGYLQTDFGDTSDRAFAVAVQVDGKLVLGGQGGDADLALARFAPSSGGPETFDLDEGELFVLTGSFTVPEGTTSATLVINWGDGNDLNIALDPDELTFSASHTYQDNTPSPAPYTITATITTVNADDKEASATAETTAAVVNVDPVAGPIDGPAGGVRYQTLSFVGAFSDAGIDDTHEVRWDFGDGSFIDFTPSTDPGALQPQHFYNTAGEYTVTLTVRDDDGGEHAISTTVEIVVAQLQTAPCGCGEALYVGGTSASEVIAMSTAGSGLIQVAIDNVVVGTFAPTHGIVVFGGDGNDDVAVASTISLSAWLYGGDGNDRLKGGSGLNVLLGGDGDDLLVGGTSRDILIGGWGADRIIGNGQDDLLIAGYTDHDDNAEALCHILAEWTSNKLYYSRVLNLTGLLPAIDPQNGSFFLNSQTVHDDGVQDLLTGSSGFDWFLANLCLDDDSLFKDKITDRSFLEIALDIDFING